MPRGGYLQWDARHFKEVMYLDGKSWQVSERWGSFKMSPADNPFVISIQTAAGTHVLQRGIYPFGSGKRPDMAIGYDFALTVKADDEEEYFNLVQCAESSAAVYFVPYVWVQERIRSATAGDNYVLWRPQAWGVAPEASEAIHPPQVFLNGSLSPSSVTVTGSLGQNVAINDAGDISIRYLPAFKVVVTDFSRNLLDVNDMDVTISLHEVFS